ncbi:hypothetical protein [Microbacterium aureliae]
MSTDSPTRRTRGRARRGRTFAVTFAAVVGVLALLGAAGAVVNVAQGPRISSVQVDPEAAVAASGSRLIFTTSQSLADIDASQVTVTPATPFAVDTSGRSAGVRFTLPLWDDTEYTVRIDGVTGLGGGPDATLEHTFRTASATAHLLQRGDDEDTVFATDLSGENAVPVFRHPHIEDFRTTAGHLVVSVRTEDDEAALLVTDLDGENPREIPLPGDGFVTALQSADRGERIGFVYSDANLGEDGGRESQLYTVSLGANSDFGLVPVAPSGVDPRIAEWRFVPDTDSILLLSFDGSLLLTGSDGANATSLGNALSIQGIPRGSTVAVVERLESLVAIDLTDASEEQLPDAVPALGRIDALTPLPDGSTIRSAAVVEGDRPTGRTAVAVVDPDGASRVVFETPETDAVLQTCASPSGRYLAVLVAPDAIENPYDTYLLPLPGRLETRVIELADASEVVALAGSSMSWCQTPPL